MVGFESKHADSIVRFLFASFSVQVQRKCEREIIDWKEDLLVVEQITFQRKTLFRPSPNAWCKRNKM